jgi:hypothetical protein
MLFVSLCLGNQIEIMKRGKVAVLPRYLSLSDRMITSNGYRSLSTFHGNNDFAQTNIYTSLLFLQSTGPSLECLPDVSPGPTPVKAHNTNHMVSQGYTFGPSA